MDNFSEQVRDMVMNFFPEKIVKNKKWIIFLNRFMIW